MKLSGHTQEAAMKVRGNFRRRRRMSGENGVKNNENLLYK